MGIETKNRIESRRRLRITLLYYRTLNNLTQGQVAAAVDFDRTTYWTWENGKGLPDPVTLMNIAHYYKIQIDDLLDENKVKEIEKSNST